MAVCEHCGNEYDKSFQVIMGALETVEIVGLAGSASFLAMAFGRSCHGIGERVHA